MGNRAVIVMTNMPTIGIYLHWNGGPESVLAFLEETKLRGARDPGGDTDYAFARLVQTVADYFTHSDSDPDYECSVGVGPVNRLDMDNGDNGTYYVGEGWHIVKREHTEDQVTTVDHLSKAKNGKYPSPRERYDGILESLLDMRRTADAS